MRVAHFLPTFDSIGETYIYNFVNHHNLSEPFVIVPPGTSRVENKVPGERVTICQEWGDVAQVLKRERIDIVHAHTGGAGADAVMALQLTDLPLVVTFYGDEIGVDRRNHLKQESYRVLYRLANRIMALTEYHKRSLIELGCPAEKIVVVRLGVDLKQFNPVDHHHHTVSRLRVLTVCKLIERKGIFDAIDAFRRAQVHVPEMEFYIAGEGPLRPTIERYIDKADIRNSVYLLGALPNNMIAELMQRADIFLLPCITTEHGDEDGSPMTLLEAQATGVPVLSTRHGGIPELVADGVSAGLVEEHDIAGLSQWLQVLATDVARRNQMGAAGRRVVEQGHNIDRQIERMEAIYSEVVGEPAWFSPNDYYDAVVEPVVGERSILVLHEGPLLTLHSRLHFLRDHYPQAEISLVMSALHAPLFEELPFVVRIYSVPDDLVSFLSVSRRFIWKLRKKQFDQVIISAGTSEQDERLNLELLALACGGTETLAIEVGMAEVPITLKGSLRTFVEHNNVLRQVRSKLPVTLRHYLEA